MKDIDEQPCTVGCQESGSSCCKKGSIFIPEEEYDAIVVHLLNIEANESALEFKSRCKKGTGYYLYDQKTRCQFLDSNELCKLHNEGVKPSECYWWPLHVYLPEQSGIQNSGIQNSDIPNPDIPNPDIPNPDIPNPDIPNPDIPNPDIPKFLIRAANCCSGCQKISNKDIQDLKERARQIGKERLIDFRRKYPYGNHHKLIDEFFY